MDDITNNSVHAPNIQVENILSQNKDKLSFLASLSNDIPENVCDPMAVHFKQNFISERPSLEKILFDLFNKEVFENRIPVDTELCWSDGMYYTSAICFKYTDLFSESPIKRTARIQLSEYLIDCPERLRDSLIHEMCHAATFVVNGIDEEEHGPIWKEWASKANDLLPDIPKLTPCHSYPLKFW